MPCLYSNFKKKFHAAASPKRAAKKVTANRRIINPKKDITNPAIAKPRGALNTPQNENTAPKNQIIHPKTGIQENINPNIANTKPAVPNPLDLGC